MVTTDALPGRPLTGLLATANPGPALVVALSDMRDRFRLVANVVENVEAPDLPKLPVGRAIWKPQPDFATSAGCWLAAGAAHHTVLTTAVGIEVFRDFAEIAKTELVVIVEPYIVSPTSPGRMQTPADGLRIAQDAETIFFGQLNQAYGSPAPTAQAGAGWRGPVGYVIE